MRYYLQALINRRTPRRFDESRGDRRLFCTRCSRKPGQLVNIDGEYVHADHGIEDED